MFITVLLKITDATGENNCIIMFVKNIFHVADMDILQLVSFRKISIKGTCIGFLM